MSRTILTIVALMCLAATLAIASSTPYEPPEGGDEWQMSEVVLKATEADPDATGKAVLACNMRETQHRIQLSGQNLQAGSVYSVWLVMWDEANGKVSHQLRADNPERPLKADEHGKLSLAANLPHCPQSRYNMIVVRRHPDGNSENTESLQTVLKGDVP